MKEKKNITAIEEDNFYEYKDKLGYAYVRELPERRGIVKWVCILLVNGKEVTITKVVPVSIDLFDKMKKVTQEHKEYQKLTKLWDKYQVKLFGECL